MVKTRLFTSQIVLQIIIGRLVPLALLAATQVLRLSDRTRVRLYMTAGALTGIFAMRWNVSSAGSFSRRASSGTPPNKMGFATREGLLPAILLMLLPFGIPAVLVKLLPPWTSAETPS